MKNYDFKKAKQIIEQSKDCLESASLGMHEDWAWTGQTIFEDGEFKKELPDNADELYAEYSAKRKAGMSILSDEATAYESILIGGIYGSEWATPTLQLCFKDGEEKMISCFVGDGVEMDFGEKIAKQIMFTSGCISSEVQANIQQLEM